MRCLHLVKHEISEAVDSIHVSCRHCAAAACQQQVKQPVKQLVKQPHVSCRHCAAAACHCLLYQIACYMKHVRFKPKMRCCSK
jgi:hypothetical protein